MFNFSKKWSLFVCNVQNVKRVTPVQQFKLKLLIGSIECKEHDENARLQKWNHSIIIKNIVTVETAIKLSWWKSLAHNKAIVKLEKNKITLGKSDKSDTINSLTRTKTNK
jgi:hypothetical protein